MFAPSLAAAFAFSATTHAGEGDRAGDRSETYLLSNKATNEKARISAEDLSKMTQGEVRKIDGNKVTIKHSSPDLSTSAMVMTFDVLITHDPQPASRADMASEGLPRLHAPILPTCS